MTPRIKLTPYRKEGKVNGAWVYRIWLVTVEQERHLGFAQRTPSGIWSAVFSNPSSSEVIKRLTPSLRAVRPTVAVALRL